MALSKNFSDSAILYWSERLIVKEFRGKVSVPGIRQQDHNVLAFIFRTLSQLHRCSQRCTSGDTDQYTFAMGKLTAILEGIFIADGQNFIVDFGIERFRHKTCANALNLVRACRSAF